MFRWLGGKKKHLEITAPMAGEILPLSQVPDQMFSTKMLGDGFAVRPVSGQVLAPCRGRIVQIFPTGHAVGLETDTGIELLVHVGIDTVELKGDGFTILAAVGDEVSIGTPLLAVDLDRIEFLGKSCITPVIITNMERVDRLTLKTHGAVAAAAACVAIADLK